ncbi:hypothetical protein L7F22_040513 [Adiantum nelumboides]|nr:hypothetical protein [Adiantum nelumboides]
MCIQGDNEELPLHHHQMEGDPQVPAPLVALRRVKKRERRSEERRDHPALHLLKVYLIWGIPPLQMLIQGNHVNGEAIDAHMQPGRGHPLSKSSRKEVKASPSSPLMELLYWVSQGNKWCDFCKIYIANNSASIRTHEAGQRHKDNVAKKLNDIRKENASKEKERQQAMKDMERIEAQARRSYQKDLAAQEKLTASAGTTTDLSPNGRPPDPALKESKVIRSVKGKASSLQVGKRKRQDKPESISKEEADALKAREAAKKRVQEREKGLLGLYQSY